MCTFIVVVTYLTCENFLAFSYETVIRKPVFLLRMALLLVRRNLCYSLARCAATLTRSTTEVKCRNGIAGMGAMIGALFDIRPIDDTPVTRLEDRVIGISSRAGCLQAVDEAVGE